MARRRLDEELVAQGFFRSISDAMRAVMAGDVSGPSMRYSSAGTQVRPGCELHVRGQLPYVSRGGLKLERGLDAFGMDPAGLACLDVGCSTGGFTDCLLSRGATDALSGAVQTLREAARYDDALGSLADALESSLIDIEDVASQLRDYRDGVELDPEELARMQQRMASLQGLMRTFGPTMGDVLARRDRAREMVEAAGDSGERERKAKRTQEAAEAALAKAADALDAVRAKAAPRFAKAVTAQMGRLEMGSAQLEVALERLPRTQWGAAGPSKVELMYRPGAGLTARPLRRIASGGEVSRVMLACKVVLGEADGVDTLVFDEVDAGVGGSTARALAAVLADLAKTHQVIVVTHLAQVAVQGERHYLVAKHAGTGDVPETQLAEISGDARVAEIARMLSGDTSELSLEHAQALLAEAGRA